MKINDNDTTLVIRCNYFHSQVPKNSQSFQGLIQVFFSVCQLCDGGMTLRSTALSFSHLNANEHAAVLVKVLQKQCEFLISYHTKR